VFSNRESSSKSGFVSKGSKLYELLLQHIAENTQEAGSISVEKMPTLATSSKQEGFW
jgi:hypothetical protein